MVILTLISVLSVVASHTQGPSAQDWRLIWSDEFDGEAINAANWTYDIDCWGGGNNERQCYTDRLENARITDGLLVIEARREAWTGDPFPPHWGRDGDPVTREYTSARLTTRGLVAWRYGRFEIRAQLPFHQGSWPAIWMLPENNTYGSWAASGEIDIMEAVNLGVSCDACPSGIEDRIWGTLHYGGRSPANTHSGSSVALADPSAFHTYAVEWTPQDITWFVDGEPYARQTSEGWHTEGEADTVTEAAPFDQPFHLILNLAIGGDWPESANFGGISEDYFPRQMRVDFVRVYVCRSDAETLQSCRHGGPDEN